MDRQIVLHAVFLSQVVLLKGLHSAAAVVLLLIVLQIQGGRYPQQCKNMQPLTPEAMHESLLPAHPPTM